MITEENNRIIKRLSIENTLKINNTTYNHSKLLEELIELSEVLSKKINKTPDKQPSIEKVIEEMGDVFVRLHVLMTQEGLQKEIKERITQKLKSLDKCLVEGRYKGGV